MSDQSTPEMTEDGLVIRDKRPRNPWLWTIGALAVVAFVVGSFLVFQNGNGLAIGLYLTVITAVITGLILEKVDSSRSSPRDPSQPDSHWGFRGRPGA